MIFFVFALVNVASWRRMEALSFLSLYTKCCVVLSCDLHISCVVITSFSWRYTSWNGRTKTRLICRRWVTSEPSVEDKTSRILLITGPRLCLRQVDKRRRRGQQSVSRCLSYDAGKSVNFCKNSTYRTIDVKSLLSIDDIHYRRQTVILHK